MANRDVSIAICGAVMGVIIGAGSLTFSQDVPLTAAVGIYRGERIRVLDKGEIKGQLQPRDASNAGIWPTDPAEQTETVAEPKEPETVCEIVMSIVEYIGAAHEKAVPNNIRNTASRAALSDALATVQKKHCTQADVEASGAVTEHKSAPVIDVSACARFTAGSVRFTQCLLEKGVQLNQK